jgi:hypothetical protein
MFLDIGNIERIDDPTPEQISARLRDLSNGGQFLILDADAEHFIQASQVRDAIRVEWLQEGEQRFMVVSLSLAIEAFDAFRRWDEAALQSFTWRRVTPWNDPYLSAEYLGYLALALIAITLLTLWVNWR